MADVEAMEKLHHTALPQLAYNIVTESLEHDLEASPPTRLPRINEAS